MTLKKKRKQKVNLGLLPASFSKRFNDSKKEEKTERHLTMPTTFTHNMPDSMTLKKKRKQKVLQLSSPDILFLQDSMTLKKKRKQKVDFRVVSNQLVNFGFNDSKKEEKTER